ncbi:hypothetical protein [Pseudogemmobacter faecipullorum]|uniref:Uncharacterized protein n=1 Tax=Pseudogemmobacter faecipullorum TaxID=2755041 RepID=A0ABS8CPH0_9RHOB|nr:hypothetical protein [Pseudogemmobacter faecipullorum]MCB5411088.1 hypothetical protein [Pseudogemmobacter faecipullorum]
MTFGQLIISQLSDPFRIALLIALIWTMMRTRRETGMVIPLLAGVVFVAALIPSTTSAASLAPFFDQFLAGLLANAMLTALLLGLWQLILRLRSRG